MFSLYRTCNKLKPINIALKSYNIYNNIIIRYFSKITDFNVIFGSQTGTAMHVAHNFGRFVRKKYKKEFNVSVNPLNEIDYNLMKSENDNHIKVNVIVVACFGVGEPTDNAKKFCEWLNDKEREKETDFFSNVYYCVFGLGQSVHYPENYQAVGKMIDSRLAQLGATKVMDRGEGDDAEDIDEDFEKWNEIFWDRIDKLQSGELEYPKANASEEVKESPALSKSDKEIRDEFLQPSAVHPQDTKMPDIVVFPEMQAMSLLTSAVLTETKNEFTRPLDATVSNNIELFSKDSGRSCRHLEFTVDEKSKEVPKYWTGDYLSVFPKNEANVVDTILNRLNLDPEIELNISDYPMIEQSPIVNTDELNGKMTLREMLTDHLDLTSTVPASALRDLAEYAKDKNESDKLKFLSDRNLVSKDDYKNFVAKGFLAPIDVLNCFQSIVTLPYEFLLDHLKPLAVRYYSIASSPLVDTDSIHACVSVVKYKNGMNRQAHGVASNYLANLANEKCRIFIKHSVFRLVPMPYHSIIMIGAGTGIAPFRAFLRDRVHQYKEYPADDFTTLMSNLLIFGCSHRNKTFLYKDELEEYENQGYLKMHLAFSRDQPYRRYVQHVLLDSHVGAEVWDRIVNRRAFIYVCGDNDQMAPGVHEALILIGVRHGGMTHEESSQFFQNLLYTGRYLLDVY